MPPRELISTWWAATLFPKDFLQILYDIDRLHSDKRDS